ncbi:hypothetical protein PQQ52_29120 [Paraburkholderia sediminicola]|uniref:hypothetical protein n=1 Tax=Paraburkholderia sediminicola TaxID=458836 RepID=UPI0038BB6B93
MQRLILFVATTVALPGTTSAQGVRFNDSHNAYNGYNGYSYDNTLSRSLSSDPVPDSSSSTSGPFTVIAPGSNANMSRQARRDLDSRVQFENAERDKRIQARREPPLKFNIPAAEMPKPITAK